MYLDWTMLLLVPAILFALWAQSKVKSAYATYSQVGTRRGLTGAEVARRILQEENIAISGQTLDGTVSGLEAIPGDMTDHYDPTSRTLRLSEDVFYGNSIAALGIAAHEVGHAIQHARHYAPLKLRGVMYPVSALGSNLAWPLFFIGLIITFSAQAAPPAIGIIMMKVGIGLYTLAFLFTVVTLPVEFDASRRAIKALAGGGYLDEEELGGAKKVLSAAAMTYVAATAMAALQLVRMIILARGGNR